MAARWYIQQLPAASRSVVDVFSFNSRFIDRKYTIAISNFKFRLFVKTVICFGKVKLATLINAEWRDQLV